MDGNLLKRLINILESPLNIDLYESLLVCNQFIVHKIVYFM